MQRRRGARRKPASRPLRFHQKLAPSTRLARASTHATTQRCSWRVKDEFTDHDSVWFALAPRRIVRASRKGVRPSQNRFGVRTPPKRGRKKGGKEGKNTSGTLVHGVAEKEGRGVPPDSP